MTFNSERSQCTRIMLPVVLFSTRANAPFPLDIGHQSVIVWVESSPIDFCVVSDGVIRYNDLVGIGNILATIVKSQDFVARQVKGWINGVDDVLRFFLL